jgi:hypothetical protein
LGEASTASVTPGYTAEAEVSAVGVKVQVVEVLPSLQVAPVQSLNWYPALPDDAVNATEVFGSTVHCWPFPDGEQPPVLVVIEPPAVGLGWAETWIVKVAVMLSVSPPVAGKEHVPLPVQLLSPLHPTKLLLLDPVVVGVIVIVSPVGIVQGLEQGPASVVLSMTSTEPSPTTVTVTVSSLASNCTSGPSMMLAWREELPAEPEPAPAPPLVPVVAGAEATASVT